MRITRFVAAAVASVSLGVFVGAPASSKPVQLPNGASIEKVDFERHVMGLLSSLGCSASSCHGSFQGKGGFHLSLNGYTPETDYHALTRVGLGRRICINNPDASLVLLKASGQLPHGGGRRFSKDSWQYQVFREWIASGTPWKTGAGKVVHLEVTPKEPPFSKHGDHRILVKAKFADGSVEDVTCFSAVRADAQVQHIGQLRGKNRGETVVAVDYRGNVVAARAYVSTKTAFPTVSEVNYIDREVFAKLRKLNIIPPELTSDAEFLRRLYIDTIGTLPSPEEVRAFVADKDSNKRAKKIEVLLNHPMHAALWATKFSDITGNKLDSINRMAGLPPNYTNILRDWFRDRITDNVRYDAIDRRVLGNTTSRANSLDYARWRTPDGMHLITPQLADHNFAAFVGVGLEQSIFHDGFARSLSILPMARLERINRESRTFVTATNQDRHAKQSPLRPTPHQNLLFTEDQWAYLSPYSLVPERDVKSLARLKRPNNKLLHLPYSPNLILKLPWVIWPRPPPNLPSHIAPNHW